MCAPVTFVALQAGEAAVCETPAREGKLLEAGMMRKVIAIRRVTGLREVTWFAGTILCVLAIMLTTTSQGVAQSDTATLAGTVTDPEHAVVPGAMVTVKNQQTGAVRTVQSGGSGDFSIPGLAPSTYSLRIERQGFQAAVLPSFVLNIGDRKQLNIALKVGAVTESVTVSGEASLVTTDTGVSNVVDRKYIENMPLNGRSFQDLMLLSPGTVTNSPQNTANANSGTISVNGQGAASNSFIVDGVSANVGAGNKGGYSNIGNAGALPNGTSVGTTQSLVSVDALQEFRVETSSYSAEYGRTPGGQFSFTTRSGSNGLHGSAFDYLRNDYFDANDWFNNYYAVSRQPLRQNDFGGTLGGPIDIPHLYNGHNKTFFFANYEGLRLQQPIAAYQSYVPNLTVRAAATGVMASILNAFPKPTGSDLYYANCPPIYSACDDGLATFVSGYSAPSKIDSTSIRLDQNFHNQVLFFRFSGTPSSTTSEYVAGKQINSNNTHTYTLGLTSALPHSMTNELRANFTSSLGTQQGGYTPQPGSQNTDLLQDFGYTDSLPTYAITVGYYPGVGSTTISAFKGGNSSRQFNLTDAFSVARGKHNLKFGIDFKRITSTNLPESPLVGYDFYYPSTLSNGSIDYGYTYAFSTNFPAFVNFSAYGEDEWRLTSRLTLSYGLRWELNPPPSSRRGPLPYQLINQDNLATLALAPPGTSIYKTTYYDVAPRLGVSYLANNRTGYETIVRFGGGMFYDTGTDQGDVLSDYVGPGFEAGNSYCAYSYCSSVGNFTLPLPPSARNPIVQYPAVPPFTYTAYGFSPHLALPYSVQYSAAIQQSFHTSNALSITFVGTQGRKSIGGQEVYANAINPNFQNVYLLSNRIRFSYDSLQTVFQHRFSEGLYAYFGYTWAHAIGESQINTYSPYERANSGTDIRNNLNAVVTYEIPGRYGNHIANALLAHWGIDLREAIRSGFPLTLTGIPTSSPAAGGANVAPGVNSIPGEPVFLFNRSYPGGRSLNPAAFTSAVVTTNGNVPLNYYRGFGENQTNLAVRRDFPIFRELHLQFRTEAFNLFNRPNFGSIDTSLQDPLFGQATNSLANGLGGLGSQFQAGGPRSMQFALKLLF
jgi:hypothetical protein